MMKLIRVLHVLGTLDKGGAEARTMDVYRAINRKRVQFDFITHTEIKGFFETEIESLGGRVFRGMPRYKIYNHFTYRKAWENFFAGHEFSILHIHTTNTSLPILSAAQQMGIKNLICHARSASEPTVVRRVAVFLFRPWIRNLATQKLAVSDMAGKFAFGSGYVVVKNAIHATAFRFDAKKRYSVRQALGVEENTLVIGQVGRFHEVKNQPFTLDVFSRVLKQIPDARLLFAGDGEGRSKIEAKIEQLGLTDKVLLLGLRDDIPDLLQAFDLFLMPSVFEGLPGAAIEAQAAGLPCLLSNAITREVNILKDLVAYLPINKGVESWVDAIVQIATKSPKRRDTCAEISAAGFDIKDIAKWYENFYVTDARGKR